MRNILGLFLIVFTPFLNAAPNTGGFENATLEVNLTFEFHPAADPQHSLSTFLSTATLGDIHLFKDKTSCETQASLRNIYDLGNGSLIGNVYLNQNGYCKLATDSEDQFREKLVERYRKNLANIPGVTIR